MGAAVALEFRDRKRGAWRRARRVARIEFRADTALRDTDDVG